MATRDRVLDSSTITTSCTATCGALDDEVVTCVVLTPTQTYAGHSWGGPAYASPAEVPSGGRASGAGLPQRADTLGR